MEKKEKRLLEALKKLPAIALGTFPTPLSRLYNFEKQLGFEKIYIKRDDLSGLGPGGNKVRSLEFILGDAAQRGADSIIVAGPLQSNLCVLTACACAKAGFKCISVHNAPKPQRLEGNLLLSSLLNVDAHFLGSVSADERNAYARELSLKLAEQGARPYFIENGGTTGVGALGYVSAVAELCQQVEEAGLAIKSIFAPGGNGGVASGLIYGNALLGNPFELNIISVEYDAATLKREILAVIPQIEALLGISFDYELEDACNISDAYRGGGWGINTVESAALVQRFPQAEGIFIENVYNSKVLVALEDMANKGKLARDTCYLHTGGFGSLFSQY